MKAVLCRRHGPPESLVVEDVPSPTPGPQQVLIDVAAAGVNFPDTLIIENRYQLKPPLPFTPGGECAGVIKAIGEGISDLKVGQRVAAYAYWGAFAEQVVAERSKTLPIPEDLPFEVAAAFTLAYATSYHALKDRASLRAGETLLVLGAAGGVGLAAVEIGKALGARVIAAASSDDKLAVCREHGADMTINYHSEDLRERLKVLTDGKGPDVIYDPVGGHYAEPAFRSIAWRGRYLVIGFANGEIPKLPLNLALLKGASIVGVFWGDFTAREPQNFASDVATMFGWIAQGKLRPHISARYPLAQGARAIEDMMNRKVVGKVVITT